MNPKRSPVHQTGSTPLIDTGIDPWNPDLSDIVKGGVEGGYLDHDGHGTHQIGILGAKLDGSVIAGVAHGAKVVMVKHGDNPLWWVSGWRMPIAFNVAVDTHGANVIGMALRVGTSSQLVIDAIDDRYVNDDVMFFAASGSIGLDLPGVSDVIFPANYGRVHAVGAINYDTHLRYNCSHTGHEVEFSAFHGMPTTGLPSEGLFDDTSNTSSATTMMAGMAALIRARYPMLSNWEVKQHMLQHVVDLGAPGRDDEYGYGYLRVDLALNPPALTASISGPSLVRTNYTCTWTASHSGGVATVDYDWFFNNVYQSSGWQLQRQMTASGEVKLRVTDDSGMVAYRTVDVDVSAWNPTGNCQAPGGGGGPWNE